MKVIVVTGSREWWDIEAIETRLSAEPGDAHFVEGGCSTGADRIVREFCRSTGRMNSTMWAPWQKCGRAAGPIRNGWMLDVYKPNLVIAFPLKSSTGTLDCIEQAKERLIRVDVVPLRCSDKEGER